MSSHAREYDKDELEESVRRIRECARKLRTAINSDDLSQELIAKWHEKGRDLTEFARKPPAFTAAIVRNYHVDLLRKEKKHLCKEFDGERRHALEVREALESDKDKAQKDEHIKLEELVWAEFQKLSFPNPLIMVAARLRHEDRLTIAEIAVRIHRSDVTVNAYLGRVYDKLRYRLKGFLEDSS